MTPEEQKEIAAHSKAIAKILYKNTETEELTSLGKIESAIFKEVATIDSRREILDWYHLMENLHKIGGSNQRLFAARSLLWLGKVNEAIDLFNDCELDQSKKFCAYLEKHRHRIVNYYYLQAEQVCAIGSGSIESTIKQIDRRTQISGAQWKSENIPQVLAHRYAYLNGLICDR
jgi:hypothetical protein